VGHKTALRVNAFLVALIVTSGVYAHGGVSVENDTCIMSIGPYRAHFTGYQPAVRASQEFCEDIPVVAKSIIVLDFISQPLRVMAVDFRVIRDVNNIGNNATFADLGAQSDIDQATVFYREPKQFPRGSVDVDLEFDQAGSYIGILTAVEESTTGTIEHISVFPFSVGVTNWWGRLKWIVYSLVLGAGLFAWSSRSTTAQKPAA
jgi:hypothetical protein